MPETRTICKPEDIMEIFTGHMKEFLKHGEELVKKPKPEVKDLVRLYILSNEIRKDSKTFRKVFRMYLDTIDCNMNRLTVMTAEDVVTDFLT